MPATIHYDITDILEYARHNATLSGIQRVSVQLLSHIVNKHGTDRLRLIGWHPIKRRIVSFDASYFSGGYKYEQEDFCRHFRLNRITTGGVALRAYLKGKYGRSWKRPVHHARLALLNALTAGHTFEKRQIGLPRPQRRAGQMSDGMSLAPGDLVFIVGATWGFDALLEELSRTRRTTGILLYHFVHDLIPLLTPEHVERGHIEKFSRWLTTLGNTADCLMTNSLATKRDLDAWLAENGFDVETRVIPLAHQFADWSRHSTGADKMTYVNVLNATRLPYVLCVGTIESRKNIWMLANVWREVHTKLGMATPRLILAGKHGWLKDDFDNFIRGTGSLYGYIHVIDRPSDAELAYLYRNCLFSIFPSYKEGWGLPVGEGLWFGRPVVCSNTSSIPEVGGSLADYVDPTCWESIETAVLRMITEAAYRERRAAEIAEARLRTWADVGDELWRVLTCIDGARHAMPRCQAPGQRAAEPAGGPE